MDGSRRSRAHDHALVSALTGWPTKRLLRVGAGESYLGGSSHTNVDTTLNVYRQVLDASVRNAVAKVGDELFTIVHNPPGANSLIC